MLRVFVLVFSHYVPRNSQIIIYVCCPISNSMGERLLIWHTQFSSVLMSKGQIISGDILWMNYLIFFKHKRLLKALQNFLFLKIQHLENLVQSIQCYWIFHATVSNSSLRAAWNKYSQTKVSQGRYLRLPDTLGRDKIRR